MSKIQRPHSASQALSRRTFCQAVAGAAAIAGAPRLAFAADEPTMTITVNAGGIMDSTARLIAERLRTALSRDVVVMQKFGAGGQIAMNYLKQRSPDGRDILLTAASPLSIAPSVYKKLDYDPAKDFTPITGVAVFDNAIAVRADSPIKSIADLVKTAAARPDGLIYGCAPGTGSAAHFMGIAITVLGKFKGTMAAYKEASVGELDLMGGRLEALIRSTGSLAPLHKDGRARILAVSGSRRSPLVPDVPTLKEAGMNVVLDNPAILLGPARMQAEPVRRIHEAIRAMIADPAVVAQLHAFGMNPWPVNSAEVAKWTAEERQKIASLAQASGFVPT